MSKMRVFLFFALLLRCVISVPPSVMRTHLAREGLLRIQAAPPSWPQSWAIADSLATYACNYTGFFDLEYISRYSLVVLDWSTGKEVWANEHPMDAEALLVEQVRRIRAVRPNTIMGVYRNTVKALSWFSHVRVKLLDPSYSGWFLPYRARNNTTPSPQSPPCDAKGVCSALYHDQLQTPQPNVSDDGQNGTCADVACDSGGVPTGEYLWDLRNESARAYMLANILGPTALGDSSITILYLDDYWSSHQPVAPAGNQPPWGYCTFTPTGGPSEISYWCIDDMGLAASDVQDLIAAWSSSFTTIMEAMDTAGALSYFSFNFQRTPGPAAIGGVLSAACSAGIHGDLYTSLLFLELTTPTNCCPPTRNTTLLQFDEDLAFFQIVRGPNAWLGYSWDFCAAHHDLPEPLFVAYGDPLSTCSETAPGSGVWQREFQESTVFFNVTSYRGSIVMK